MKITLIAVGTKMPKWVQQGYEEYAKRLPKELTPTLVELGIGHRGKGSSVEKAKSQEAENIIQAIPNGSAVIALDVLGKHLSTQTLSKKMSDWQMNGRDITLLIGGPDGIEASILKQASELWSLSDLTLPHPLVRVVLIEQLYRAWTILQNHPYHK